MGSFLVPVVQCVQSGEEYCSEVTLGPFLIAGRVDRLAPLSAPRSGQGKGRGCSDMRVDSTMPKHTCLSTMA